MSDVAASGTSEADAKLQLGWSLEQPARIGFAPKIPSKKKNDPILTDPEGHLLTVAPTGKGKGRSAIIPTLLDYPGAVLAIDPKGEAATITARRRADFGKVVIIDPFHQVTETPDSFNPFDMHEVLPGNAVEHALMLSELIQSDHKPYSKDMFWDNRATSLISGLTAYVLERSDRKERTLSAVYELLSAEDIYLNLNKILARQDEVINTHARHEISQLLQLPDNTRGGVVGVAQQHLYLLGDEAVQASLAETTFDLRAFIEGEPITIYLVLSPTKLQSHRVLLRLWVATLLNILLERKTVPELPNLFIIDEAAQLGTLSVLQTAMTLMRGYGLRCWTLWQDLSQLKRLYADDWQTIINNAAALQTFGMNTHLMAKELAEIMGYVSPEQLLQLDRSEQVIMQPGGKVEVARKLDYLRDDQYRSLYDQHPLYGARRAW